MSNRKKNPFMSWKLILAFVCMLFLFVGVVYGGEQQSRSKRAELLNYHASLPEAPVTTVSEPVQLYDKLKGKEEIKMLIIGDSIADGAGAQRNLDRWYYQLATKLYQKHEVNTSFKKLTMPGATVLSGWVDVVDERNKQSEVGREQADLIVVCFGHNDQTILSLDNFGALYDKTIRFVLAENPGAEIVTIIENSITDEAYAEKIREISSYYNLLNVDTRNWFMNSGVPYADLLIDQVHPNSQGHQMYAEQIYHTLLQHFEEQRKLETGKPALYKNTAIYDQGSLHTDFSEAQGFQNIEGLWMSTQVGSSLGMKVKGSVIALSVISSIEGAPVEVWVDGQLVRTIESYSPTSLTNTVLVTENMTPGEHEVRLVHAPARETLSSSSVMVKGVIVNSAP